MTKKKWSVLSETLLSRVSVTADDIITELLSARGITAESEREKFLSPPPLGTLIPQDVGINPDALTLVMKRIAFAILNREQIVVYADYDADGITAGTIMWETIRDLGGRVMPYIPHRVDEGYGLSEKGIDSVIAEYDPKLIITVDHGITAWEKIDYAKRKGVDLIVTDHHVQPDRLPDCPIIHTTMLCGAGVAWFVGRELYKSLKDSVPPKDDRDHIALAAIGTIADMIPLTGVNRSIVKWGLSAINNTKRVGLLALVRDSGLTLGAIGPYDVSHILAPRLNAMGRLVHAMDAMRLLCTGNEEKASELATLLGQTNRDRQTLTAETVLHATTLVRQSVEVKKLLFVLHETYNPGVIGLVAGRLVEEFYRPAIVVSVGELYSKASARSISGFNIVEVIKTASELLVDVGGHPMAAGFTVETVKIPQLRELLEAVAERDLTDEMLTRTLRVDCEIPGYANTEELWKKIQTLQPFGFGNPEPVFVSRDMRIIDTRTVGADGKHLKLRVVSDNSIIDGIGFGFGGIAGDLSPGTSVDIAYTLDMNEWNGRRSLQMKIKDINKTNHNSPKNPPHQDTAQ